MAGEINTSNLIQGPAEVYVGAFGAAEPATPMAEVDEEVWRFLGATDGGATLNVETEWSDLIVDQLVEVAERRLVGRNSSIATSLAEATLANMAVALNADAPTTTGNVTELTVAGGGLEAFKPNYFAVLLRGASPNGGQREVIIRKALSTESVESAYTKDGKTLIPVTFRSHYVSKSIASMRRRDEVVTAS